jgi:hypothetical protein
MVKTRGMLSRRACALIAAVVFVGSACGQDDPPSATPAAPTTTTTTTTQVDPSTSTPSDPGQLSVEFVRRLVSGGDLTPLGTREAIVAARAGLERLGPTPPAGEVRLGDEFVDYLPQPQERDNCPLVTDVTGTCVVTVSGDQPAGLVLVDWSLLREGDGFGYEDGIIVDSAGRPVEPAELRPEVIGVVVLPSAVVATGRLRTVEELTSFRSPSANIGCALDDREARCDIAERVWEPPPAPEDCELDFGQGISVTAEGRSQFVCAGDTTLGAGRVLPYGERLRAGELLCASAREGMACVHLGTGGGFRLARESFELWG